MDIVLTDEHSSCVKKATEWWNNKKKPRQYFEISGAAGTGKSTIIEFIIKNLGIETNDVKYVAFTGKAAMALSRKNCPTKTIHSIFYHMVDTPMLTPDGAIMKDKYTDKTIYKLSFTKKSRLEDPPKLIVIDEGSMVSEKVARDILSFKIPVLVLGDLNQLEPVMGKSFFLRDPDFILTKPLRQKLDDPIIKIAHSILNGERLQRGKYGEGCYIIDKSEINEEIMREADIILCGKNVTRNELNIHMREDILGHKGSVCVNDKIICRKNNWNLSIGGGIYLINGIIGYVDEIFHESFNKGKNTVDIDFRPEFLEDDVFEEVSLDLNFLYGLTNKEDRNMRFNTSNLFEWGHVITTHLSQGSEYENVLVYNEFLGGTHKKWLYTAVTRARSGLIIAL